MYFKNIIFFSQKLVRTAFLLWKFVNTAFLSQKYMRLSIAFKDLLDPMIAPQIMPHCRYHPRHFQSWFKLSVISRSNASLSWFLIQNKIHETFIADSLVQALKELRVFAVGFEAVLRDLTIFVCKGCQLFNLFLVDIKVVLAQFVKEIFHENLSWKLNMLKKPKISWNVSSPLWLWSNRAKTLSKASLLAFRSMPLLTAK